MGRAQDHLLTAVSKQLGTLHLVFPGDQRAVRKALTTSMGFLRDMDVSRDDCGPIELVLAEVINNVVEHAYKGRTPNVIELTITRSENRISVEVVDDGFPMPDGQAPVGLHQDLNTEPRFLPEGGFGWFLIRELTRDLRYSRDGNRNRLRFTLQTSQKTITH